MILTKNTTWPIGHPGSMMVLLGVSILVGLFWTRRSEDVGQLGAGPVVAQQTLKPSPVLSAALSPIAPTLQQAPTARAATVQPAVAAISRRTKHHREN